MNPATIPTEQKQSGTNSDRISNMRSESVFYGLDTVTAFTIGSVIAVAVLVALAVLHALTTDTLVTLIGLAGLAVVIVSVVDRWWRGR